MRKNNLIDMIKKSNIIHNNKYDYSKITTYSGNRIKVQIICPIHGDFFQPFGRHIDRKQGCPLCAYIKNGQKSKKSKNEFINDANKIHNNKYDYSLVEYYGNKEKVKIICLKHGEFEQTANSHLNGSGCPKCGILTTVEKTKLKINEFLERSMQIHNNKYDYSLVEYINGNTKIKIICPDHGEFLQTPHEHLSGKGCYKCGLLVNILSKEDFIKNANNIHNNKYDYSLIEYDTRRSNKKLKILCPTHKEFFQTADSHLKNRGCQKCNRSKGEECIMKFLNINNITYVYQKTFKDCKGKKNLLPFDFYIPDKNLLIEYDGKQHTIPCEWFGGQKTFIKTQETDMIKNRYSHENNINLIRISYSENIIEKLKEIFNC